MSEFEGAFFGPSALAVPSVFVMRRLEFVQIDAGTTHHLDRSSDGAMCPFLV